MRVRSLYKSLKREIKVYRLVLKDKRTPRIAKLFLGLAVSYIFLPFDLIPDFIPVLGHVDDVIIIPLLIYIALKLIPNEVILDNRRKLNEQ